ncbi:hypothetical protein AVEN_185218-1, partial [Araneus ventricosus]
LIQSIERPFLSPSGPSRSPSEHHAARLFATTREKERNMISNRSLRAPSFSIGLLYGCGEISLSSAVFLLSFTARCSTKNIDQRDFLSRRLHRASTGTCTVFLFL